MAYRLADGIYGCVVDGTAIILDVPHNRYIGLPAPLNSAFVAHALSGADASLGGDLRTYLEKHALIAGHTCGSGLDFPLLEIVPATDDCAGYTGKTPSILNLRPLLGLMVARVALRLGRLEAMISVIMRLKAEPSARDSATSDRIDAIAASYRGLSRWISTANLCLPLSLALARSLLRAGSHPDVVIGVRLAPFAAHCWVQLGARVMNDSLDEIRKYTPILMV